MKPLRLLFYSMTLVVAVAPSLAVADSAPQWSATGNLGFAQGFQKNAKATSVNSFRLDVEIPVSGKTTHSFEAALMHDYTWGLYEDQKPSQIESLDFSYEISNLLKTKDENLYYSADLGVPVSEHDRTSGFRGSADVALGYRDRKGAQSYRFEAVGTAYSFAYDTADFGGTVYNKKAQILARAAYAYHLSKRLAWGSRVDLSQYVNVIGTIKQEYYFGTGPSYAWTKNFSTFAKIITTDAIETYKTPLAEEITSARVGLEWSI